MVVNQVMMLGRYIAGRSLHGMGKTGLSSLADSLERTVRPLLTLCGHCRPMGAFSWHEHRAATPRRSASTSGRTGRGHPSAVTLTLRPGRGFSDLRDQQVECGW